MKKIGEYFKLAYISASAKWIFGTLAALSILPDLVKTMMLCITKEPVQSFLQICFASSVPLYLLFLQYVRQTGR